MPYLSLLILCGSLLLAGCSGNPDPSEHPKTNKDQAQGVINPEQNGCRRCHLPHQDKAHTFSCSTCHAGDETSNDKQVAHTGLIATPAHPATMNQACGQCHQNQVAGVAQSLHLTLAREVNLVRKSFGAVEELADLTRIPNADAPETPLALADDLLRRRCLRCHLYSSGDLYPAVNHGTGCAACHLDFRNGSATPTFLKTPGDKQCLQCHYGNWVGADYHGRFEHDFNDEYRTPYTTKEPFSRPYGVEYHQLSPDIHQQRGMICVDCHSGAELMNGHPREGAQAIQCQDCHRAQDLEKKLPANVSLVQGKPSFKNNSDLFSSKNGIRGRKEMEKSIGYFLTAPKYFLQSKGDNRQHEIPLMRDPAHTASQETITCQACHAQWAFNDGETHLLRNDTNEYDTFWKLTTQGSWEVENLLTQNLNSDTASTLPPTMRDKISGEEKKGIWHQGYTMRRWESVQLGRDEKGRISVMRPLLDLHLSWLDDKNKVRFDAVAAQATPASPATQGANKGLQPYTPHTTGHAGLFYRQRLQEFYRLEKAGKDEKQQR